MRIRFVSFVVVALAACGNDAVPSADDDPVDAGADAALDAASVCPGTLVDCDDLCVNTSNDPDHCGGCGIACTPAGRCDSAACACPAPFLGATPQVLATQMIASQPGFVSGVAGVAGSDANNHGVIVTAGVAAALNTPLAMNGEVFVAIAYELLTADQARSSYLATAGTVRLTRRCAAGIAGTLSQVALVEVDPVTLAAIPGGCTTMVPQLAFDIGAACP